MSRREAKKKRGWLVWAAIGALVALAILYWRCGGGFGIGAGSSVGRGEGSAVKAPPVDAGIARCQLRITGQGITVDGKPASQAEAVAACQAAGGADVVVTGDARQGDWEAMRAALDEAGVRTSLSQP